MELLNLLKEAKKKNQRLIKKLISHYLKILEWTIFGSFFHLSS